MVRASLSVTMPEERKEEIEEAAEEGNWQNRSAYIRQMIRAGESRVAALDPRTDDNTDGSNSSSGDFVTDEAIVSELVRLTEAKDGDFVSVSELADTFVEEVKSDITDRVYRMANDDSSEVITDKQGGYKVNNNE